MEFVSIFVFGLSLTLVKGEPGDKESSVLVVFFMEMLHCLFDRGFVRSLLTGIVIRKIGLTELWHIIPKS